MATENKTTTLNLPWSIEHEGGWYGTDIYRIVDDAGDEVFGTARFTDDERAAAEIAIAQVNAYPQLVSALYNLWLRATTHGPLDKRLELYLDEAADALDQAGIDLTTGKRHDTP